MGRSVLFVLLVCILDSFSLLAYAALKDEGLLYHDSGLYLLEA